MDEIFYDVVDLLEGSDFNTFGEPGGTSGGRHN